RGTHRSASPGFVRDPRRGSVPGIARGSPSTAGIPVAVTPQAGRCAGCVRGGHRPPLTHRFYSTATANMSGQPWGSSPGTSSRPLAKTTHLPSGVMSVVWVMSYLGDSRPSHVSETRLVTPVSISRTNTSAASFVSSETRLGAEDENPTYLPPLDTDGPQLFSVPRVTPSGATLTSDNSFVARFFSQIWIKLSSTPGPNLPGDRNAT